MSKSKTNFNTFLSECEEYEPVGTNGNRRERHQHDRCVSASVTTTNNGNNGNNIFLNSNSNYANANAGAAAVVDSSKLVLNDDNFPSLSSSKLKPEIQNNKINFKNALSSSSHILLQQQHEQQKRLAAIAAAATLSNVSHILVKKESEYIANKIILSKRFSTSNKITSIKSSKIKISNNDDDYDDDYDDDDDYDNDNGYDE